MINSPQGRTQQCLTTPRIYFAQQRRYTISLPKTIRQQTGGGWRGGSVCHPNNQEYLHVFVLHIDLSTAQVDKCTHMCPDANTHIHTQACKCVLSQKHGDFVLLTTKFGDAAWVTLADTQKVLMNGASKANNSNGILFFSISQMVMFFWVDIKDSSLFCHLKGNDKIVK